MGDGAALFRSVLEAPQDDAPRLVLADWLDEHSSPERGEFVRVQVELARLAVPTTVEILGQPGVMEKYGMCVRAGVYPCHPDACGKCPNCAGWREANARAGALRERERGLLAATNVEAWAGDLLGFGIGTSVQNYRLATRHHGTWLADGGVPLIDFDFARGFVAHVTLATADFLAHAKALGAACPLEGVRLSDREPQRFFAPEFSRECWVWYSESGATFDAGRGPRASTIPSELATGNLFVRHETCAAANAALSAACVNYARNLNGLPPLPAAEPAGAGSLT
jgi:uncharacterized protein (TIGR02996 family)